MIPYISHYSNPSPSMEYFLCDWSPTGGNFWRFHNTFFIPF